MPEQKDIEQAKTLFKQWDLNHSWHATTPEFIEHSRRKAKDSLELAIYLLEKLEKTIELERNDSVTIWIVALGYYSMFFEVEYLFSLDGKKLPKGTPDTHRTMYLAFLYYYLIKGSELEQGKKEMTTSRMSKALVLFKELQDETLELQRVQKSVEDLKKQRLQRNAFTYHTTKTAELLEAKNSISKAIEFRQLVEEYILSKKR